MTKLSDFFTKEELETLQVKWDDGESERLKPKTFQEIINNPPESIQWVVDQLFPIQSISILGGEGGVGKSWLCLLLALSVASGQPFLGRFPVKKGRVLIVDEEAPEILVRARLECLLKGMELTGNALHPEALKNTSILNLESVKVDEDTESQSLANVVSDYCPDLVIIDSLVRVHSADENSAQAMQEVFRQIQAIVKNYNTTVLLTHHTRKPSRGANSPSQLLRGSSDIRNFIDSYLFMRKATIGEQAPGIRKLIHDKSRFGVEVKPFNIEISQLSDQATAIQVVGSVAGNITTSKQEKLEEAKAKILDYLRNGKDKAKRQEIISAIKEIGMNTKDKVLKELEKEGIIQSEGGGGKAKKYWLT